MFLHLRYAGLRKNLGSLTGLSRLGLERRKTQIEGDKKRIFISPWGYSVQFLASTEQIILKNRSGSSSAWFSAVLLGKGSEDAYLGESVFLMCMATPTVHPSRYPIALHDSVQIVAK